MAIILFDGVCNLCNGSVQFIIKRDKKAVFKFASLQSDIGQSILKEYKIPAGDLFSIILVENNKAYSRSTAALHIARRLDGAWKILYIGILFPKFLRDRIYDWVAKNRYRWFGKKEECMIPSPAMRERFL